MLDVEKRVAVARRRSVRHRNDFDWLGDHYVNQEAPEVSLQGDGCSAPSSSVGRG